MNLKPLGTYILIEALEVEEKSGAILLPKDMVEKEQMVENRGKVIAIGPCAYVGWKGCDQEGKTPAECWGIHVGDIVEHAPYDNRTSKLEEGNERYRFVHDVKIYGGLNDD